MRKLSLISKDIFSCVDYSRFTDYNSGWKEVIERRQHFSSTYRVPPRIFEKYIASVRGITETNEQIRNSKIATLERNFYHDYWEDIFTHFPFIPSCKFNVMLNNITHKFLLFKAGD